MFCRLGSLEAMRPVAALVWLYVVWMRPVCGLTARGERVEVGAFELVELAIVTHEARQLVHLGQLLEDGGVGGATALRRALQDRQAEVVEEDLLQLVARTEREVLLRDRLGLAVERLQARLDANVHLVELRDVDLHADLLHVGEDARASGSSTSMTR